MNFSGLPTAFVRLHCTLLPESPCRSHTQVWSRAHSAHKEAPEEVLLLCIGGCVVKLKHIYQSSLHTKLTEERPGGVGISRETAWVLTAHVQVLQIPAEHYAVVPHCKQHGHRLEEERALRGCILVAFGCRELQASGGQHEPWHGESVVVIPVALELLVLCVVWCSSFADAAAPEVLQV